MGLDNTLSIREIARVCWGCDKTLSLKTSAQGTALGEIYGLKRLGDGQEYLPLGISEQYQ